MKNKSLLVILPLALLGEGCSTVAEQQPPKPAPVAVRPKPPAPPKKAAKKPAAPVARKQPAPTLGSATYAIDDGRSSIKVEPSMPVIQAEPLAPTVETPAAGNAPMAGGGTGVAVGASPAAGSPAVGMLAAPVAPAVPAYAVEDVRIPTGTPPAVIALLGEADRSRAAGDFDSAVVSTERALRIDSRNPTLTYKLAQLRIKQNKPQLAEELAGKAALLAGGNLELKRKSWLLIAEARRMRQDYQGAKEAKAKADSF